MLAVPLIEKKKWPPALLLIYLACLCHTSAMVFLPAVFLLRLKITKPYLTLAGFGILIGYIFHNTILHFFVSVLVLATQDDHYEIYSDLGMNIRSLVIYTMLLTFGCMLCCEATLMKYPRASLYYNGMIAGCALLLSGSQRVSMYYTLFMCLLLPDVFDALQDKGLQKALKFGAVVALTILCYKSVDNTNLRYYTFFWEG